MCTDGARPASPIAPGAGDCLHALAVYTLAIVAARRSRSDASTARTPNSRGAARRNTWSWATSWDAAGAATPVFCSAHRGVEGSLNPGRHRDHVKVVQESDEAEKRGVEGVPLLTAFAPVNVPAAACGVSPAARARASPRTPPVGLRTAVRRERAMASNASWGAWARAATLAAKVKASSASASSRSNFYSSTDAPDKPAAEPRSKVRNASPTWRVDNSTSAGGRNWVTSEPTVRNGCAGRRCGSVSAWSVSASPLREPCTRVHLPLVGRRRTTARDRASRRSRAG